MRLVSIDDHLLLLSSHGLSSVCVCVQILSSIGSGPTLMTPFNLITSLLKTLSPNRVTF